MSTADKSGASDDFYVGYLPAAPGALGRWTRAVVVATAGACLAASAALTMSQADPGHGVFEFGLERDFEGWVETAPVPRLVLSRPGSQEARPSRSSYLLTVFGKRGAGPIAAEFAGQRVRLRGQLVYRDEQTMVEIDPKSIEPTGGPPAPAAALEELGNRTFRGEIVDSKCFWGVMKPGNTKPHSGCAARCISGGVPPVLLVRDDQENATYLLLASEDGGTVNEEVLDKVAEPVEITGRLVRYDELLVLYADPATYRRIDG